MKVIKKILLAILFVLLIPYQIINVFIKGFKTLSLFLSRGFYFYFEKFFSLLKKITHVSFFENVSLYFKRREEEPSHIVLLIVWFLALIYLFDSFYVDNNYINALPDSSDFDVSDSVVKKEENALISQELNLYRKYSKYNISDINFEQLRKENRDTIGWIIVEGTSINYPIVQTDNNDYYLNHSYDSSFTHTGWIFMDYRNDVDLNDQNTIIYGHNLMNGTAFGSISNLFNKGGTINIMIITSDNIKYTYQVFSGYEIEPEVYYLQTGFPNKSTYQEFLYTIAGRNILGVSNGIRTDDKIITLSTCTDDNRGRKVIHARLIGVEEI